MKTSRLCSRWLAAIVVMLLWTGNALAADSGSKEIVLTGAVETPLHMTAGALRALPPAELTLDFMAGPHPEKGMFKGVLLWKLVSLAAVKNRAGKGAGLLHSIIVTGRDGRNSFLAWTRS